MVRVETNMKLNLAMGSERLIGRNDKATKRAPEIHYIMFEGLICRDKVGFKSIFRALKKRFGKPTVLPEDGFWQMSDFDYFMQGNPHDLDDIIAAFGGVPPAGPNE